ncbi:IS3 family transposase [Lactobacillus paragasseri]|nr:IS3 family transposase [Lactobacillus paragasseri]MDX5124769.1 IS3 family transposase [Lactobacillus paragasseri]MDX5133835.1 IS3 family transposase [Lactobacillus paragasseri]
MNIEREKNLNNLDELEQVIKEYINYYNHYRIKIVLKKHTD